MTPSTARDTITTRKSTIRIGGASGYWGENVMATPQLLKAGGLDYIVYDYLAEITMSILARAKAKDPTKGYATDFISFVLQPNLAEIARQGVKLISNAGGVNPDACAEAARALIENAGLDLKVAVVTGDNLMDRAAEIAEAAPKEMFTGDSFPSADKIASINAYLGAFPIAEALARGADIVITGRCVDSAVTLGACIHEFGWDRADYHRLASGSLAGHILECGPQATGGNFTDWRAVGDMADIGYPIAEIAEDGAFALTKPDGTSGLVSVGTVSEQMLYEIGDPQDYILPDVRCDFSDVIITADGADRVRVSTAKGAAPTPTYKTCATYADGFRTGMSLTFYGFDAAEKAKAFADAAFTRARRSLRLLNAADFAETSVEVIGAGSQIGATAAAADASEVVLKLAARHPTPLEGGVLLKEIAGLGLSTAPGLSGFQGGRAKPSPVMRLFSFLTPKEDVSIQIDVDGDETAFNAMTGVAHESARPSRPEPPAAPEDALTASVPLIALAWARSGDKGDKANIGVIARKPDYLPYLWAALSEDAVASRLAHFIEGGAENVERFFLPGAHAINFLVDKTLGGGGVASLRNDPQGKGYAQILLSLPVPVPEKLASALS